MYHPISSILAIVFPGISRSRFGNLLVKLYDSRQKYSDWNIQIFRFIQIFDKRSWISLWKHLNFHLEYDGDILPCFHRGQGSLGFISPDLKDLSKHIWLYIIQYIIFVKNILCILSMVRFLVQYKAWFQNTLISFLECNENIFTCLRTVKNTTGVLWFSEKSQHPFPFVIPYICRCVLI